MGLVVSSSTLGILSAVSLITSAFLVYKILASRRFLKSIRVALVLSITVADFVSSAYPTMFFAINPGAVYPGVYSTHDYIHSDQAVSTFLAMNFVYCVGLLCLNAEVIARNKLKALTGQRLGALKVTFFISPWLSMLVIFQPWFGHVVLTSASINTFLSFFTLLVPVAVSAVATFVVCSPRMDQTHQQLIQSAVVAGTNPAQDRLLVGSFISIPGIQEGSVVTEGGVGGMAPSLAPHTAVGGVGRMASSLAPHSVTSGERPPSYQESQLFQTTRSALQPAAAPSTPQDATANSPTPQDAPANSPTPQDAPANSPTSQDAPANSPTPQDALANSPTPQGAPANMGYTRFDEGHELRPKSERRQLFAVCMTFTFLSLPLWISVMIVVNGDVNGDLALLATVMHLFTLKSCIISIMWIRYLGLALTSTLPPCTCCFPGPPRPRVIFAD